MTVLHARDAGGRARAGTRGAPQARDNACRGAGGAAAAHVQLGRAAVATVVGRAVWRSARFLGGVVRQAQQTQAMWGFACVM